MEESGEWEILGSDGSPRIGRDFEEFGGGDDRNLIKLDYFALESEKKRGVGMVFADDQRKKEENEVGIGEGSSSDNKFGGVDFKGELGVEEIQGGVAKVNDLSEFIVVSEEIRDFEGNQKGGFVEDGPRDEAGLEGTEEIQAILSANKDVPIENELVLSSGGESVDDFNQVDEGSQISSEEVMIEGSGSSGDVVMVEGAIEELKSREEAKKQMVWWKLPIELFKFCIFRVSPVWTFSVAAAVVGIVLLRRRLHKMKRKSRSLQVKLSFDEKTVSRFNEAISVVRRVPIIRPSLPATGLSPWPMVTLR